MLNTLSRSVRLRLNILKNWLFNGAALSLDTKKVWRPKTTKTFGKSSLICLRDADIILGNNVTLNSKQGGYHGGMPFKTCLLADAAGAKIKIGNNTRINGAYIHAKKEIVIGDSCVVASGVNIIDSNGHALVSFDRAKDVDIPKEVVIGNNVWICINSIILKGTTIGDNCVVAANSVVKGYFPPNCVIQGNPATIISELPKNRLV